MTLEGGVSEEDQPIERPVSIVYDPSGVKDPELERRYRQGPSIGDVIWWGGCSGMRVMSILPDGSIQSSDCNPLIKRALKKDDILPMTGGKGSGWWTPTQRVFEELQAQRARQGIY